MSTLGLPNNNFIINCKGQAINCNPLPAGRPSQCIMGILNVTPDSFSDGGKFTTIDAALHQTERMLTDGAQFIDVGGESTRPKGKTYGLGAETVATNNELQRVVPVIDAIHKRFPKALISVDTYKLETAKAALDAGASIINDITGLRIAPEIAELAVAYNVPLILMHSVGNPGEMPQAKNYHNVIDEVKSALQISIGKATSAGVKQIIIDPGFGFGKTVHDNLTLAGAGTELLALNRPVLIGISRKSTVGTMLGNKDSPVGVHERLYGTLGITAMAVLKGASIVRTHDVKPTADLLKAIEAMQFLS